MPTTLSPDSTRALLERLAQENRLFSVHQPGDDGARRPVHVVYGGAQLFKANTAAKFGQLALTTLGEHLPDARAFADTLGLGAAAEGIRARVLAKLASEPVEDFRLDFEDGYGHRPDAEEDRDAEQAASEVARGAREGTLPPFIGIRIKALTEELRDRSVRTLDLFVSTLTEATAGQLPPNFVVTLPKVQHAGQVAALAELLSLLETARGLPPSTLKMEIMVEVTPAIVDAEGRVPLPGFVRAAAGRCVAVHFGTYDYTASCDVVASRQSMTHPASDFAKHVMKASLSGLGVGLCDGATNVLPIGRHRAKAGEVLSAAQLAENTATVRAAMRLHYDHVRRSLDDGWYQGWDLHPAQLPARYAAIFSFFREGLPDATARLTRFVAKAAQASRIGDVFDDAATGQGLLNFFLRGLSCGALEEAEATATGLTVEEIRLRNFLRIVTNRRKG